MRVAVSQSNYIPWRGYFDLINSVDAFVFLENVQYTKQDWRNRNRIQTPQGTHWLSIPILAMEPEHNLILDARFAERSWQEQHLATIRRSYARAPYFAEIFPEFAQVVESLSQSSLSELNIGLIRHLCQHLGIDAKTFVSTEFPDSADPTVRILNICLALGATTYLSSAKAKTYLNEEMFTRHGIAVEWFEFGPYARYEQVWGHNDDALSILDTIFNVGLDASRVFKKLESKR